MNELQKQKLKDKIITEVFLSGEMEKLSMYLLNNMKVSAHTYIYQDLVSETFMHLCRKTPEYLIELWQNNPRRVYGLCKTIMILKGITSKDKNEISYNKHSLLTNILFASNLKPLHTSSTKRITSDDDSSNDSVVDLSSFIADVMEEPYEETDRIDEIWGEIKQHLDKDDLDFMAEYFNIQKTKKVGRYSNQIKNRYRDLEQKIIGVVHKHQININ